VKCFIYFALIIDRKNSLNCKMNSLIISSFRETRALRKFLSFLLVAAKFQLTVRYCVIKCMFLLFYDLGNDLLTDRCLYCYILPPVLLTSIHSGVTKHRTARAPCFVTWHPVDLAPCLQCASGCSLQQFSNNPNAMSRNTAPRTPRTPCAPHCE